MAYVGVFTREEEAAVAWDLEAIRLRGTVRREGSEKGRGGAKRKGEQPHGMELLNVLIFKTLLLP